MLRRVMMVAIAVRSVAAEAMLRPRGMKRWCNYHQDSIVINLQKRKYSCYTTKLKMNAHCGDTFHKPPNREVIFEFRKNVFILPSTAFFPHIEKIQV